MADGDERLESALSELEISPAPEARFDRIVELVRLFLDVPFAGLSLLEQERQWFKAESSSEFELGETTRSEAFCSRTILWPEPMMVVEDARLDERFVDNPLVVSAPKIVFYAGVVLFSHSHLAVGTLCAIDTKPRQLPEKQRRCLQLLGGIAQQELLKTKNELILMRLLRQSTERKLLR